MVVKCSQASLIAKFSLQMFCEPDLQKKKTTETCMALYSMYSVHVTRESSESLTAYVHIHVCTSCRVTTL